MDFHTDKPIYLQIVEYVYERILEGQWREKDKIISVRELAANLEVNPNTVMRAYEKLQQDDIIFNKRGIGFFVVEQAITKIKNHRKESFIQNDLTQTLHTAKLLGISKSDILALFEQHLK